MKILKHLNFIQQKEVQQHMVIMLQHTIHQPIQRQEPDQMDGLEHIHAKMELEL